MGGYLADDLPATGCQRYPGGGGAGTASGIGREVCSPDGRVRRETTVGQYSAYSQARGRLPLNVAEKVSDLIFESLQPEPKILSGLAKPMFLLDGSSIQLPHTKGLWGDGRPEFWSEPQK
jgi:hypothetical protein